MVPEQEDETEARPAGLLCSANDVAHVPAPSGSLPPGLAQASAKLSFSGHAVFCASHSADGVPGAIALSGHNA